jgi:hypothetical protein
MLSDDLNALAITFGRYCVQGGRMFTAEAARALHYVLADLADQAAALERQVAGVSSPLGQNEPGPLVIRNDGDPDGRWAGDGRGRLRVIDGGAA